MPAIGVEQFRAKRAAPGVRDWALFDVRERGEAEDGHIFGATSLPRRQLEYRIEDLVPARGTEIVLYDDGDGRAELAVATLAGFGYGRVSWLDGGLDAWKAAGEPVIWGSNVPPKAFGERVHVDEHPPAVTAAELRRRLAAGEDIVICDVRTPEEYREAHIPGGIEAPSFDVALNAFDLSRRHATVVVNCAGRTRSIIAARTLQLLGHDNVVALENGTSGWLLAAYELEQETRRRLPEPSRESVAAATAAARRLAEEAGVRPIAPAALATRLAARGDANIYACDVRALASYREGHIPGTVALPGGQAVQRADDFFAVPAGEILLVDDDDARAAITGYWLRRIGYPNVWRLEGGLPAWRAEGRSIETGRPRSAPLGLAEARARVRLVDAASLLSAAAAGVVLDVGPSRQYVEGHLPGARWLPRGWLEARVGGVAAPGSAVLVTAREESQAIHAAARLTDLGYDASVLAGGTAAWRAAGGPLETGEPAESYGGKDYVVPPYLGGDAAMQRYLKWEIELTEGSGPAVAGRL